MSDFSREYTSECGGFVEVHALHGKHEKAENVAIAKILADRGERIKLLPINRANGVKNLDAERNGEIWDFKQIFTPNTKNGIQNAIKSASKQKAENVLIYLLKNEVQDVIDGLIAAFQQGRGKTLQKVDLLFPNRVLIQLLVEEIRNDTFEEPLKIRFGNPLS